MAKRKSSSKKSSSGNLNEQRQEAFMSVLDDISKKYGKGAVLRMDDQPMTYPHIPTGSLGIDILLGIGGFPMGRITEIYGPAGGGKSTIALHAIREAMREAEYIYEQWLNTPEKERGPEPNQYANVVYIDMESALNKSLAEMIGVDVSKLYLAQPDSGEEALDVMEMAVNSGVVDIVVLDSVAALVPRAEIEGEMGASHVGLQARLMNQALRKIGPAINKTKTVAIFINQVREKVNVMFGSPETTPGGRGLPFYASVRLRVSRIQNIKEKGDIIGMRVKVDVKKNKMAPPFGITEYDLFFDSGISSENEILDIGADLGLITKRGAFYYYSPPENPDEEVLLGQGRNNAREFLQSNIDIRDYLYKEIINLQLPHLTLESDDDTKPKKKKHSVELEENEVLVEEVSEDV